MFADTVSGDAGGDMDRRVAQKQCRKILITGTHSAGKTDLLSRLTDRLHPLNIVVIPEIARDCPFTLNRSQNYLSTTWLIAAQVKTEIESQTRPDADMILCDRGIPDILAYHEAAGFDELGRWLPAAIDWISTYDRVFLAQASPDHAIMPDELRLNDPAFQSTIARAIEQWIIRADVSYKPLPHDPTDRLVFIETDLTRAGWLT
jgi:predicted ATPase